MRSSTFALLFAAVCVPSAPAQLASNVVLPQSRAVVAASGPARVEVTAVSAEIDVAQHVAVTTLTIHLANASPSVQEAELLVPVPERAVVRAFDFEGKAAEPTARILSKEEAKSTYDSLVARARDPALLEFKGSTTIRTSVFPVPGRGTQRVRLVYEHVLDVAGDRVDYELPRSESLASCAIPWTVEARVAAAAPIAALYSPTHAFKILRAGAKEARLRLAPEAAREPGPIQFSFLLEGDGINASFYCAPEPGTDGGWFLLLAGAPPRGDAAGTAVPREVIVVIDTSGSMAGPKMEQAKAAALQVLESLGDGESFNVIDYDGCVSYLALEPLIKSPATMQQARDYVKALRADGATNLHDALLHALDQPHAEATLPIVLFLTDGLPTAGVTSETAIGDVAVSANRHARRIFTFGVGDDVNAPLLDRVAESSRARSEYVRPDESVEKKVSEVCARLAGPALAAPSLAAFDAAGKAAPHRVRDLLPQRLPDLFEGDPLVLLGRWRGKEPIAIEIAGEAGGKPHASRFVLDPASASPRNAFVPRLWAARRIGELVDALRQSGADPAAIGPGNALASDPRFAEICGEVLRLSTEFGIMTEYTAFLALEGTDLADSATNLARMNDQLQQRLRLQRSGRSAVVQAANLQQQTGQIRMNRLNRQFDAAWQQVEVAGVAQIADRAFYKRGDVWVDSRLPRSADPKAGAEVVPFGTERHRTLVDRLLAQGRQGIVALRGEVLLDIDGKAFLLQGPPATARPAAARAAGGD